MLSKTILLTMFQYNHHMNNRVLDFAVKITPEQWNYPLDLGQRTLHETLFHLLTVEEEWISLCQNGKPIWGQRPFEDFPDVASLRAYSDQVYSAFSPYFESLTDEHLASMVYATMPQGVDQSVLVWHMLIHMLYHSAQHRSEVASMLTRFGHSPGYIDFNGYAF